MEKQTVRQAMQQGMTQQNTGNQAAQQSVSHQKIPQGASAQKVSQMTAGQNMAQSTSQQGNMVQAKQQAGIQGTSSGVSQQNGYQRSSRQHISRQQSQARAQQKRADQKKKNNIMKILLCAVIILQMICIIELFLVLRSANTIIDKIGTGALSYGMSQDGELSGAVQTASSFVDGNAAEKSTGNGTQGAYGSGVTANVAGQSNAGSTKAGIEEEWNLILVNKWNPVDEDYVPELTTLSEGHKVDSRIADELLDMIHGAKEAGYSIYILSAYRDIEKQTTLYEAEVQEWLDAGYSRKDAEEQAGTVVAVPGTSEHHLGLAVDLVSSEHVKLDEGAEKTKGYKWLVAHCHEYGFILRYPNDTTEITGIIYEPWHFRYVGVEAATEIMEEGITLEEYLERL